MEMFSRVYDRLMYGMAWFAGFLMAMMMITICVDVLLRNLGFQSSAHLFTFTEYALLIVPCLGAPWLVRERGHVYVEIVLMHLNAANRRRMGYVIGAFCIAVCAVLAWYGFDVTLTNFLRRDVDVRSMDMPRWMIVIFIPLSFAMMAFEFLRHMLRGESVLGDMASAVALKDSGGAP
jgi:C4-dicarboxylate transporter, DctQ subunit